MTKCAVEGCDTTEKNKGKKGLWLHKFPKGQLISKSPLLPHFGRSINPNLI